MAEETYKRFEKHLRKASRSDSPVNSTLVGPPIKRERSPSPLSPVATPTPIDSASREGSRRSDTEQQLKDKLEKSRKNCKTYKEKVAKLEAELKKSEEEKKTMEAELKKSEEERKAMEADLKKSEEERKSIEAALEISKRKMEIFRDIVNEM